VTPMLHVASWQPDDDMFERATVALSGGHMMLRHISAGTCPDEEPRRPRIMRRHAHGCSKGRLQGRIFLN